MKEESVIKLLKSDIKDISLEPVIFIYGSEDLLKKQFIDKLKNKSSNFHFLWGDETNLSQLTDIFSSGSLFSEGDTVVVWDIDTFISKFNKSQTEEFLKFLKSVKNPNLLILISKKDKIPSKGIYKSIIETAFIINSPQLTPKAFEISVYKKLQREGKEISIEDLKYLISILPNNLYNTKQEIEKLLIYTADKKQITKEDIDAVITTKPQVNIFVFQNQFLKKDINAIKTFQRLVEEGQHPFEIQSFVLNILNKLLYLKTLIENKTPKAVAFSKAGINYKPQQTVMENALNVWNKNDIIKAIIKLYETEKFQKVYYEDLQKKFEEYLLNVLV
jgi:DNA polymerase-3 subunit delta